MPPMMDQAHLWTRFATRRARLALLIMAVVVLALKVLVAMRTYGTEDIRTWAAFADGVKDRGPVGIYGINFRQLNGGLYNHPPLVGYYLEVVNALAGWGVPLKVTIRVVSSIADVVSSLVIFEILRRRTSLGRATLSGILVTASPVLFLISGYHGNTDPLFLMLVLLGGYLVVDKRMGLLGSAAFGLAIGVKLVPVIVLPTIAVYLIIHRRELLARAAAGFGFVVVVSWLPAVLGEWGALERNVFGYSGIAYRPWGLVHFADTLGWSSAASFIIGPGKDIVLVVCALAPAVLVWRRPQLVGESICLSLVLFLVLSNAFGVQYLAWALAAAYLLDVWSATLYNILGGIFLFEVYDKWNNGFPWSGVAAGQTFTAPELAGAALVWASLVVVLVRGTQQMVRRNRAEEPQKGAVLSDPTVRSPLVG